MVRGLGGIFPRGFVPVVSRGSSASKKVPQSRQLRRLYELSPYNLFLFCCDILSPNEKLTFLVRQNKDRIISRIAASTYQNTVYSVCKPRLKLVLNILRYRKPFEVIIGLFLDIEQPILNFFSFTYLVMIQIERKTKIKWKLHKTIFRGKSIFEQRIRY